MALNSNQTSNRNNNSNQTSNSNNNSNNYNHNNNLNNINNTSTHQQHYTHSKNIPYKLYKLYKLAFLEKIIINNKNLGYLSEDIGNLKNLIILDLSSNNLTRNIPKNICNLTKLRDIILSKNQLTGHIPENIDNLTELIILDLSSNNLTGNIPENICDLTNLHQLNLSKNELTGQLPMSINNLRSLSYLNLSSNNLIGNIPENLYELKNLVEINLENNKLTGNISENIGNLTNLLELNLSKNKLTGKIPISINNLKLLRKIKLKDNNFTLRKIKNAYLLNNTYTFNKKNIQKFNISNLIKNNINYIDKTIYAYIFSGNIDDFINEDIKILQEKYPNINIDKRFNEITTLLHNRQKKIYPKIYNAVHTYENLYNTIAHGCIDPNSYLFVPSNLSIITLTTPSYLTYINKTDLLFSLNKYYLDACLPGISYKKNTGKNQLRFFEPGDIINNIYLNFKMNAENNNKIYQGGIIKADKFDLKNLHVTNSSLNNKFAQLKFHSGNNKENNKENISWPEITPTNYTSTLQNIISKFKNKPGHYVLIVGSCLYGEYEKVKNKSIIYKKYDIIEKKLACFQNLAKQIENNKNNQTKRLQNFSSTIKKKQNCYNEIISKLKKKINTISNAIEKKEVHDKYNELIKIYKENELFTLDMFISIVDKLDDLTTDEIAHYYNINNQGDAENKRQSRINQNNNQNNIELPKWLVENNN